MLRKSVLWFCSLNLLRRHVSDAQSFLDFNIGRPTVYMAKENSLESEGETTHLAMFSTDDAPDTKFALNLEYDIGGPVTNATCTYYYTNCTQLSNEPVVSQGPCTMSPTKFVSTVLIDPREINSSPLTTFGDNFSTGEVTFCVKTELLNEDGVSVIFNSENLAIGFDLMVNDYAVQDNVVQPYDINTDIQEVSTRYRIDACRCDSGSSSLACISGDPPDLQQNGLIHICIFPNSTDVAISNFDMKFVQDDEDVLTAVTLGSIGPEAGSLSAILGTSTRYKIVSRLVTSLFLSDSNTFDVTGTALLEFRNVRRERRLVDLRPLSNNDRVLDEVPGASAGEAPLNLEVQLRQISASKTSNPKPVVISLFVIGGCAAIGAALLLVKKYKK